MDAKQISKFIQAYSFLLTQDKLPKSEEMVSSAGSVSLIKTLEY